MYELELELAYKKVAERNRVRREAGIPTLDTRAETFSAFSTAVVSQWESDCDRYEGVRHFISRMVAAEIGPNTQRVHLTTRRLFYREMEHRFGIPIPQDVRLQAIFNEWWEARHAAV